MRPGVFVALLVLSVLAWGFGCRTLAEAGTVSGETWDGICAPVLERHDAYVLADHALEEPVRVAILGRSSGLRLTLGRERVAPAALLPDLEAVCGRHDAYLRADPTLAPAVRDIYLTSSALLLRLAHEAGRGGG